MPEPGLFERQRADQINKIRETISAGLKAEGELAGGHLETVTTGIIHDLIETILKADLKLPGAQENVMRLAAMAQTARQIYVSMFLAVQRGRMKQAELTRAAEREEVRKREEGGDEDEG